MKKTLVISGFPGIGKSDLFKKAIDNEIIVVDSDSSKFSWQQLNVTRNPDFPNNYIQHIKSQIGFVDIILVSSHIDVRQALSDEYIFTYVIYPAENLFDEYIERYIQRGSPEKFVQFMRENFKTFVKELDAENLPRQNKLKIYRGNTYLNHIVYDILFQEFKNKYNYLKD